MRKLDKQPFFHFIQKDKETIENPGSASRYYLNKMIAYEENSWFMSWNWSAFFFGYVWMFYRKMYFFGFITFFITKLILGLSIVSAKLFYEGFVSAAILLEELDRIPLTLVWMIFLGLFSNALYFNFADRAIKEGNIKKSGTSIWIALLVCILSQCIDSAQIKIHQYYNHSRNIIVAQTSN